ncbi:nuclear transport factor 2 family protein [Ralstonia sp. 22086]|uniref:nuclear transport factor 2 family protein n=1 Tax=Ralstonia TaxID=48736 RepID=UPI0021B4572A|nr:nuclear transport factor 2 family protein [Ralstonia wenshanensis]MCT7309026.1 nuclear transport factor 2 family protein [Ralstonia wenshanensis]
MLLYTFVRRIAGVAMTAALAAGSAFAHATTDADTVAQAVERMRVAMVASDGATLTGLIENDLTYGHSSGKLEDRAAFLKTLDGTNSFKSIALTNQTVQINGDNAWVRHVFDSVNNLPDGKTSTAHIGVLQVWKKHPDGWRLFARQAYLLPKE